jgi:sarcosine oxidase subunit alpha
VFEALTDDDVSAETLPFMSYIETTMAGVPARLYRISFSGELAYEVAAPSHYGKHLWDAVLAEVKSRGGCVYGTEALHIMRAEKGFIMIGDETDGTVTPQDLNLGWAVSKKKEDFIGKRAQQRSFLAGSGRKQLVGLATEDPKKVLPDGAHAVADTQATHMRTIGHVTSTYWSPTIERSIAMALIEDGLSRDGEVLSFPLEGGEVAKAKIVDPVFFDKEGARNV